MRTLSICLLCLFAALSLHAQWDGNTTTVNNPVSTSPVDELYATVVSDGAGGIIAVWATPFDGSNLRSVYAQRKTSAGTIRWGSLAQPVTLFTAATSDLYDVAVQDVQPDGSGGVYVSWQVLTDDTTSALYLQHLNSQGTATFTAGGMSLSPIRGSYLYGGKLVADAAGVIVCWSEQVEYADSVLPAYAEVVVQRFNTAGAAQWGSGVKVSAVPAFRAIGQLIGDGSSGAFVSFVDTRNSQFDAEGNSNNLDIYAQHISSSGARLWAQDAVVAAAPNNQLPLEGGGAEVYHSMISDGAGGLILVYEDYRSSNDSTPQFFTQRLNAAGTRLWAADGVQLNEPPVGYSNHLVQALGDGANGLVAGWVESEQINSGTGGALVCQRITAAGTKAWGTNGVVVGEVAVGVGRGDGSLATTAGGMYMATWIDVVAGEVKAQLLNNAGQIQFAEGGVPVCSNPESNATNPILTKSEGNNMIVVWSDQRNAAASLSDLYAAKINTGGSLVSTLLYTTVASGNWNNPATWQGGVVPPQGADVLIQNAVIVTADATCNSLTVQLPGSIRVNSGVHFTVLH